MKLGTLLLRTIGLYYVYKVTKSRNRFESVSYILARIKSPSPEKRYPRIFAHTMCLPSGVLQAMLRLPVLPARDVLTATGNDELWRQVRGDPRNACCQVTQGASRYTSFPRSRERNGRGQGERAKLWPDWRGRDDRGLVKRWSQTSYARILYRQYTALQSLPGQEKAWIITTSHEVNQSYRAQAKQTNCGLKLFHVVFLESNTIPREKLEKVQ